MLGMVALGNKAPPQRLARSPPFRPALHTADRRSLEL